MSSIRASRILKNTILLYFRSIIVMVLAIFTSRVLLATLGVDDFGLYSVVGGIVAMFSSIKSVLAAAVQRFINFEKGKEDKNAVNEIFCTSLIIHVFLAVSFVLVLEPIGCWYIENKLVIPEGSLNNALFVFHCSVAATFITMLVIPYDALVISNEKMSFYAWMSIFDAVGKLLIIFLLPILPHAYVKSYAFLILMITLIHRLITVFYCNIFPESKIRIKLNKQKIKDLGVFAGWNFLGCTASSLIEEGSNLIFNAFGGVVANTARGLAYQVKSAVANISNNVVVASQPFVTQQAAVVEKDKFFKYIHFQSKIVFYCTALVVLPIYIYAPEFLALWLKEVPPFAAEFVRAVLIYTVLLSFQKSIDLSFKSYGNIAKYQIIDTLIIILTLPTVYVFLKVGLPMHYAFYGFSLVRIIDYVGVLLLAKKQLGMNLLDYVKNVVLPSLLAFTILATIALVFIFLCKATNVILLLIWTLLSIVFACVILYYVVMNKTEKDFVKDIFLKLKRKKI